MKPDGSVLSQHRDNKPDILGPDTWCVVGGAVETSDSDLKAAAVRELEEETGYKISPDTLDQLIRDEYVTERGVHVERTIFWGRYDGVQLIETHEGQEIRFVAPSEFGGLEFYTGHESFLRQASEKGVGNGIERED